MRVNHFYHKSEHTTPIASIGTAFDAAKKATVALDGGLLYESQYRGNIVAILAQFSSISGAASVTLILSTDAGGDEMIMTDTSSDISAGATTATDGTAIWKLDIPWIQSTTNIIYGLLKTNAGTVTLDALKITWHE